MDFLNIKPITDLVYDYTKERKLEDIKINKGSIADKLSIVKLEDGNVVRVISEFLYHPNRNDELDYNIHQYDIEPIGTQKVFFMSLEADYSLLLLCKRDMIKEVISYHGFAYFDRRHLKLKRSYKSSINEQGLLYFINNIKWNNDLKIDDDKVLRYSNTGSVSEDIAFTYEYFKKDSTIEVL